jgi:hypothetical protein
MISGIVGLLGTRCPSDAAVRMGKSIHPTAMIEMKTNALGN